MLTITITTTPSQWYQFMTQAARQREAMMLRWCYGGQGSWCSIPPTLPPLSPWPTATRPGCHHITSRCSRAPRAITITITRPASLPSHPQPLSAFHHDDLCVPPRLSLDRHAHSSGGRDV